jgi:uncharacterized protein (DUF58 family)
VNECVQISTEELIALRHAAESLSLHTGRIRSLQGQNHLSPFKGRGMEFDESRPYQAGDDVRSLDWRVTARTGKPYTKLFREERERPVILAVDFRPTMFFATRGSFKSVIAAKTAALLAWRATQQGDRLGGFIFTEQNHREWRPALGTAATLHFLKQLSASSEVSQHPSVSNVDPDAFRNALARLRRVTRPGSLVVLISDFRNLDQGGEAHLAQMARHCELVMIFVYDTLEAQLPPAGLYRVADHKHELTLDTQGERARTEYAQRFQQHRMRIETLCKRHRMLFLPCTTEDDLLPQLRQGLMLRRS